MRIEESFSVPNFIEQVWELISNPAKMAACLPSIESVEVLDDCHYEFVVKQKIGFISATFKIQTEILEKIPPSRLVLANKGKTILGASGMFRSTDTVILEAAPGRGTKVCVLSEIKLGGQLAILGAKLIEVKSREVFAEATMNMRKKLAELTSAEVE